MGRIQWDPIYLKMIAAPNLFVDKKTTATHSVTLCILVPEWINHLGKLLRDAMDLLGSDSNWRYSVAIPNWPQSFHGRKKYSQGQNDHKRTNYPSYLYFSSSDLWHIQDGQHTSGWIPPPVICTGCVSVRWLHQTFQFPFCHSHVFWHK